MINPRILKNFFIVAFVLCFAFNVSSHDYWFDVKPFFIEPGKTARVHLLVGSDLKAELERPMQRERTLKFEMFDATNAPQTLLDRTPDGQTPFAKLKFPRSGNFLLAMERAPATINLDADKFKSYLVEENLNSIITEREKHGESQTTGRERYRRYIKTLVQVGDKHDDAYKRPAHQFLEIIPEQNPYSLQRGERLTVRVIFDNRPLTNSRIFAYNLATTGARIQTATTDKRGHATFTIDNTGLWLIRLVYMRRCASDCKEIDWESFWGEYSFGMR
ncbi:MAG: DUF4198 domain-containing protein [Pyrinomonadaceae bacterium]